MTNLLPTQDRVLIALQPRAAMSPGGLHIPETAQKAEVWGTAAACGPDAQHVRPGDEVLTPARGGTIFAMGGKDYLILREADCLAVKRA